MKAIPLLRERVVFPDRGMVEMLAWRVPSPVPPSQHRFKYSLVYIVGGQRLLGYDNERGKGDHRHYRGQEEPFVFISIDALVERFIEDVEALRRQQ
jgi:hypothetical protein